MSKSWLMLVLAGLFEIGWAVGLKYAQSFTKPVASFLTISAIIASMYLLAKSAQVIPIGTAYAVWVGIGAVGAALLGVILFNESASPLRLFFIGLLIIAIIGLKMSSD